MREQFFCDNHPELLAVGVCEICGKPVCDDCAVTGDGKIFCNDLSHATMDAAFDELLTSSTIFEMELLVRNLHANGIEPLWFDSKKYNSSVPLKMFIKKGQTEKAMELLKKLDLLDFTSLSTYGK